MPTAAFPLTSNAMSNTGHSHQAPADVEGAWIVSSLKVPFHLCPELSFVLLEVTYYLGTVHTELCSYLLHSQRVGVSLTLHEEQLLTCFLSIHRSDIHSKTIEEFISVDDVLVLWSIVHRSQCTVVSLRDRMTTLMFDLATLIYCLEQRNWCFKRPDK